MADILQLAKCILDKQGTMTTMKLQKLCYYCQAWSLAWDDVPLIDEDFEAWANGPVCPKLYDAHKGMFTISSNSFQANYTGAFDEEQLDTVDRVLKYYGDKDPHWLSELTHLENPWKLARVGCTPGERCNKIITKESMQEYYGGLQ